MRWCRRHIFVVNSDDKEGLHWFVCAFHCRVRLELFTIWVWELPKLNSFDPSFLVGLEEAFANHQAPRLGIPNGRLVLWFSKLEHREAGGGARGTFSNVPLVPMGAGFVDYVLSILNADRGVRVVQAPGDDVEGVTELPGPPDPPPPLAPNLKVHFWLSRRVFSPPPPHLKARRPPLSRAWKARRPGRNLPWPLP